MSSINQGEAIRLYRLGFSLPDVARALNCSQTGVRSVLRRHGEPRRSLLDAWTVRPRGDAVARFWSHVDPFGDCWEWTAARRQGYGAFTADGRRWVAHRFAWELLVGPIPEGLQLDHLCRNRACVNPDHLEPVTCRVNLLRAPTFNARNAAKTHCKRGHPLSGENLRTYRGRRICRACFRQLHRESQWRRRHAA